MNAEKNTINRQLKAERLTLVGQLEDWLQIPMLILGFVWLALLVYEFIRNLSPALELLGSII